MIAAGAVETAAGAAPSPEVFTAASIRKAVGIADLLQPMTRAFIDVSRGLGEAPISVFAPAGEEGDVHVKSAWLPGRSVFTVKVAAWFAARATGDRSGNSGYLAVHDAATGDLVALLLDEHYLTDIRTAAAGAVATRSLAEPDATVLTVLGTGTQARLQVLATRMVRPLDTVIVWGRDRDAARALRAALEDDAPGLAVSVAEDPERAVRAADVIVTATGSRRAIVEGSWLRPGQHITAIGSDDLTKAELDPACFRRADLIAVDSRAHAPRFAGDLAAAIAEGAISEADIHAEIGELLSARHVGRENREQITIAKLIGLGAQDLVAAEITLDLLRNPSRSATLASVPDPAA
ncbi:ornithine cyclodeaminase family protein [Embleya sp. NPDC055664]